MAIAAQPAQLRRAFAWLHRTSSLPPAWSLPTRLQLKFVVDKDGNPTKLGAGAQGVVYKVGGWSCGRSLRLLLRQGRGTCNRFIERHFRLASKLCPPGLQALLNGCEPVAVKVVPMAGMAGAGEAGGSAAAFFHEARMLHGLRHRCVVQLAGVALHGDKALLIMEYMVRLRAGDGRCPAGTAGLPCCRRRTTCLGCCMVMTRPASAGASPVHLHRTVFPHTIRIGAGRPRPVLRSQPA